MNPVDTSIMATLCYSDIFHFPLTEKEIYERLIGSSRRSKSTITNALKKLHHDGLVCQTGPYFHLPGRAKNVKSRLAYQVFSEEKQRQANHVANKLIRLPYVRAVFLTGAVAVKNASVQDDIDILIVTSAQSLWTCRLVVTVWLETHRLRRHPHDRQVADKICPNLFLSETALEITPALRNLYTAYEVIQSQPLADPEHLYESFLSQNQWINHYLPHIRLPRQTFQAQAPVTAFPGLEKLCWQFQKTYMQSRKTRETISPETAYFHPRDTAGMIQTQLTARMQQYRDDS